MHIRETICNKRAELTDTREKEKAPEVSNQTHTQRRKANKRRAKEMRLSNVKDMKSYIKLLTWVYKNEMHFPENCSRELQMRGEMESEIMP